MSVVYRRLANGAPDVSFGTSGQVIVSLSAGAYDQLRNVDFDATGRIVATGMGGDEGDTFLVRTSATGALDATFGTNGISRITTPAGHDQINALRIQPDGRIVIGGSNAQAAYVARVNTDGSLDTGFASNGAFINRFGMWAVSVGDISFDSRGRIVTSGIWAPSHAQHGAMRLHR